ncbi:MAG TPA: CPBP family intramembrane glutamic endopeptidase [Ktedonobacteraceae bacterium]|nr:CPBP family intramembrane glutamic endopeptidase [Ktedonobacteraceae bacterium]
MSVLPTQTRSQETFLPRRGSRVTTAQSSHVVRSTVKSTWHWMWRDTLMRILPMGAAPFVYIAILHLPLSFLGLTLHDVPQQIFIGLLVGIVMAAFAATYRMFFVGPWFRWPTLSDHALQSFFYLFINAPVEELFFRGFLLAAVTQWTGWLGWGWLVSTAAYTLYHRLGKWSWRSVAGVGLAGIVFSLVYLLQAEPRTLLAVIIVHGFTTSGFLSWGDEVLYRRWRLRNRPS